VFFEGFTPEYVSVVGGFVRLREDYRAAATIYLEHDRASCATGGKGVLPAFHAVGGRKAKLAFGLTLSRSGGPTPGGRLRATSW